MLADDADDAEDAEDVEDADAGEATAATAAAHDSVTGRRSRGSHHPIICAASMPKASQTRQTGCGSALRKRVVMPKSMPRHGLPACLRLGQSVHGGNGNGWAALGTASR